MDSKSHTRHSGEVNNYFTRLEDVSEAHDVVEVFLIWRTSCIKMIFAARGGPAAPFGNLYIVP